MRIFILRKGLALLFLGAVFLVMASCNYFESEQSKINHAKILYKENKFNQVIIRTKNILQSDPANCEARILLGKSQFAKFSLLDAEDTFQKADAQDCKDPQIFTHLVMMRLYRNQLPQAQALFENKKYSYAMTLPESELLKGDLYYLEGDSSNADAAYMKFHASSHNDAMFCISQLKLLMLKKNYQMVIDKSQSCDKQYSSSKDYDISESRYLRALSLVHAKNVREAINTLETVLNNDVNAKNPYVRIQSALLLMRLYLADKDVNNAAKSADVVLQYIAVPDVYYVKGLQYEKANRFDLAEKEFQDALKLNPNHRPSLLEMANIKYKEGNIEQAKYYTGKVDAIDGKSLFTDRLDELQALKYLQAGNDDAIIDKLPHDKNAKSQYILSLAYARKGERDKALSVFEKVKTFLNNKTKSDLLEARLFVALKDYTKAEAIFSQYAKKDDVNAVTGLAQLYIGQGKFDKAETVLKNYRLKDGQNNDVNLLVAELYSATNQKQKLFGFLDAIIKNAPQNNNYKLLRASIYNKYAMYDDAIRQCDDIIKVRPDELQAYAIKANAYMRRGDVGAARDTYESLLKQEPRSDYAYLMLSLLAEKQNNAEDALKYIDKSLELNPRNVNSIHVKINLLIKLKKNDDAITFAKSAAQLFNQENAGDLVMAFAYDNLGDHKNAYQYYTAAMDNGVKDVRIAVKVFMLAKKLNGRDAAAKQLNHYMQSYGTPKNLYFASNYLMDHKDYMLAERYYELFLRQNNSNPVVYNNLAWLKLRAGDARTAKKYAQLALELSPNSPAIMDTLGQILMKLGRYDEAGRYLLAAHNKMKNNPTVIFHLAQYYYFINNFNKSEILLKQIIDLKFPEQDEARKLMAKVSH